MQYRLTGTTITKINEKSGVIQNAGNYEIEISNSEDFTDVFVLREGKKVSFNKQLYIRLRDPNSHSVKVNVVQFISEGGGSSSGDSGGSTPLVYDNTADYLNDLLNGGDDGYNNQDNTDYFDSLLGGG